LLAIVAQEDKSVYGETRDPRFPRIAGESQDANHVRRNSNFQGSSKAETARKAQV